MRHAELMSHKNTRTVLYTLKTSGDENDGRNNIIMVKPGGDFGRRHKEHTHHMTVMMIIFGVMRGK